MQRLCTDFIAVHCSATDPLWHGEVTTEDIRQWHLHRGWTDIGYHFVVERDGVIMPGRPLSEVGAHIRGFNACSVGICLVGGTEVSSSGKHYPKANFTRAQMESLYSLLLALREAYPNAVVQGHRDFEGVRKACPSFDVRSWIRSSDEAGDAEWPLTLP